MRHKKARSLLNRFTSWRKATLKSLVRAVLINQSIRTTIRKAKSVRPIIEKLITLSKKNTLFAKRSAYKIIGDRKLVSLLFTEIGPRFEKRLGGYTRIINLERRRGDDAQIVILELVEIKRKEKAAKAKKEKAAKATEAQAIEPDLREEDIKTEHHEGKEKQPTPMKPNKKFLGGIRGIFKKERDAL